MNQLVDEICESFKKSNVIASGKLENEIIGDISSQFVSGLKYHRERQRRIEGYVQEMTFDEFCERYGVPFENNVFNMINYANYLGGQEKKSLEKEIKAWREKGKKISEIERKGKCHWVVS